MADPLADDVNQNTCGGEEGNVRVPQVMEADRRDVGGGDQSVEPTRKVFGVHRERSVVTVSVTSCAPWSRHLVSIENALAYRTWGNLGEELLMRRLETRCATCGYRTVRPTRDGTRLPYPQRFSRLHVPL
jgi:hypothetical protein